MSPLRTQRLRRVAMVLALAAVSVACSDDGPDSGLTPATVSTTTRPTTASSASPSSDADADTTDSSTTTAAPAPAALADFELGLEEVGRFDAPVAHEIRPETTEAYVAEKTGRVLRFSDRTVVLDLSRRVSTGSEQGLLGLTFSADGAAMYVSFTDGAGTSLVEEYAFDDAGLADVASRRELLRVSQPRANHNGGHLVRGPDGMLWIGLGDGGGSGDPDGNGQNPTTLLGSILRIDPTTPTADRPYGIPSDNPFAGGGGAPEVWLYGVRNPWRFSFDPPAGDLWVADVGQNQWEEITLLPASADRGRGANLGWNLVEGSHVFRGPAPAGSIGPVFEYDHGEGCSITGGFVYRGTAIPDLVGTYLFADYCASGLRGLRTDGTVATEHRVWPVDSGNVVSFAVDTGGELLVLSLDGAISRVIRLP